LDNKWVIEAQLSAQPLNIALGAFLAQQTVNRVAYKAEHRKGDKPHNKQDDE
jgi:hypothetical protein